MSEAYGTFLTEDYKVISCLNGLQVLKQI